MNTYKVVVSYTNRPNAQLAVLAQSAHDTISANVATFPNPPLTMASFQLQITDFNAKLVARENRSIQDVAALRLARAALIQTLRSLANYINAVAEGGLEIVTLGGLPFYDTRRNPLPSPPAAPTNLRMRHGNGQGSIVARFTPSISNGSNEVEVNTGDPNQPAQWESRGTYNSGVATLTGFAQGIVVWVRVRTVGRGGERSAWCSAAEIRTL